MKIKNASGNSFVIRYHQRGYWSALQVSGCHTNYMGIPACITADTKRDLLTALRNHYSNA